MLQHAYSITAHRDVSPAKDLAVIAPLSSHQALAKHFDPFSWPSQAAQAAQEHPMPAKRSADAANVMSTFLAERQSKRQCIQALPSSQSSSRQLALLDTEKAELLQLPPPPGSVPQAPRSSLASPLPLPLPSPQLAAPVQAPFRRQGTPMPSRFAKAVAQPQGFAKPVPPPPMFSKPPASAGLFSMGTTRQGTPRPQPQRATRSGLAPSRSGRSRTTASTRGKTAAAYPSFR